jgi:hypothetical protein
MIRASDRKLAQGLLYVRAFYMTSGMRCARLRPRRGFRWIWNWMRRRQAPDLRHHAPACPANRWSGMELVFQRCTCGAKVND